LFGKGAEFEDWRAGKKEEQQNASKLEKMEICAALPLEAARFASRSRLNHELAVSADP